MSLVEKYTASSFLTQLLVHTSIPHSRHFGHSLSESSVHHYPRPLYRAQCNGSDEENVLLKLCGYNFKYHCYKLIANHERPM